MSNVIKFPTRFAQMQPGMKSPNESHHTYEVDFKKRQVTKITCIDKDGDTIVLGQKSDYVQQLNRKVS